MEQNARGISNDALNVGECFREIIKGSIMSDFKGFPEKGLEFLKNLAANNNKTWFEEHRKVYDEHLVAPAVSFITDFGQLLQEHVSSDIVYDTRTDGAGCMFPIDQGEGLSSDTAPYKTYFDMFFWEGPGKKTESPGYYFCLDPNGAFIFAGWPSFSEEILKKYRDAVANDDTGSRLAKIVSELEKAGYGVDGSAIEEVPRGYAADHPREALLRYIELFAQSPVIEVADVSSPRLLGTCLEHVKKMDPIQRWLRELNK